MSRILVTGGAGFIGSHLVDALVLAGNEVTVVDDMSGGSLDNLNPEVHSRGRFYECDVSQDVERINALFRTGKFEVVYHLAAYAAECLSPFIKRFNYMNNLIGSVNLINAAVNNGVRCFVFTSSAAVYGRSPLMTEVVHCEPMDSYGIAKLAVERELAITRELFGLDYVIFRPHNVFGERQNLADRYRNVVGIWMNQIMRGEPMTIFGDGTQERAFTHVENIIPVLVAAPTTNRAQNRIFNLGCDRRYSINELASMVTMAMGAKPVVARLDPRHEAHVVAPVHSAIRDVFSFDETVGVQAGLNRMAKWAKTIGPQEPSRFGEIEIEKNLPESWRVK